MPNITVDDVREAFTVLDIPATANVDEIKEVSKALLLKYHPDRTGGDQTEETEAKIRDINSAREVLLKDLSKDNLRNFVSQLRGKASAPFHAASTSTHTPHTSDSTRQPAQNISEMMSIPAVIRIIQRPVPRDLNITMWKGSNKQEDKFLVYALLIGNPDCGKDTFFNFAFKQPEDPGHFRTRNFAQLKYQCLDLGSSTKFENLRQVYYRKSNLMAFFGDYSSINDWLSRTQRYVSDANAQEPQPEHFYIDYEDGVANLIPWGEMTEEQFEAASEKRRIPVEDATRFFNALNEHIRMMMPIPHAEEHIEEKKSEEEQSLVEKFFGHWFG